MTEVIALRQLPWQGADGASVVIEARFGLPVPLPGSGDGEDMVWYCPYEIDRVRESAGNKDAVREMLRQHAALGVDSVQALYSALFIVGVEISTLVGSPATYWADVPNFGFPKPPKKTKKQKKQR